jgi:uncharacterized membrane protein YeaQ/YmgE (transglycosylase-associated protein family)
MTLSLIGLLVLFIIAAIAGSIGQALGGYNRGGIILAAAVGFIGALIGMWLSRELGLPRLLSIRIEGETFPFIWSIIGATLLTLVIGMLSRRRLI